VICKSRAVVASVHSETGLSYRWSLGFDGFGPEFNAGFTAPAVWAAAAYSAGKKARASEGTRTSQG